MPAKRGRGRCADGPKDAGLGDRTLCVEFVQTNPKKRGCAAGERYERYKFARTIGEALDAGATQADLKHDLGKGFLRISDGPLPRPAPAPAPAPEVRRAAGRGRGSRRSSSGAGQLADRAKLPRREGPAVVEPAVQERASSSRGSPAAGVGSASLARPEDEEGALRVEERASSSRASPAAGVGSASLARPEDEEGALRVEDSKAEDEITLRLRLGTIVVKREFEDTDALCPSSLYLSDLACGKVDLSGESSDGSPTVSLRCRLGFATVKREQPADVQTPAPDSRPKPPGDLRQLFGQQQLRSESKPQQPSAQELQSHTDSTAQKERGEQVQQEAQFEAAQIESYETNVSERQGREARDRELVQQGDTGPLEVLDEELMSAFYGVEGMLEWLEIAEHRQLLFRYLELQARAVRWYREPAQAYFRLKRQDLSAILEQPDATVVITPFLQEETEKVGAELFAMPEKGRYVPKLFVPHSSSSSDGGFVELE